MLRAIIVDDDPIIIRRLKGLLDETNEVVVVNEFQTGQEYLNSINKETHDFAVLDIDLPDLNGIELAKKYTNSDPTFQLFSLQDM